jgi:hypothetical protein
MTIVHLIRSREDVTPSLEAIMEAEAGSHSARMFFLDEREVDPNGFDAELFQAIQHADRLFSW